MSAAVPDLGTIGRPYARRAITSLSLKPSFPAGTTRHDVQHMQC
jgi:hypothetical protein